MSDPRPWNEDKSKPYSVTLWYDKPGESDSCSTGADFMTEKEARMCLADMAAHFGKSHLDIPYILLDGPEVHEVTVRTAVLERAERERKSEEESDRRESAMMAGMEGGIHAYNDAMGYDSEEYDPAVHDDGMGDYGPPSEMN